MTTTGERAFSWDLDDTVIGRESPTRWLGAIKQKVARTKFHHTSLDQLPVIGREIVDDPLTPLELVSYSVHSMRSVLPQARNWIDELRAEGVANYGNTGRANKRAWVDMTQETLDEGSVGFADIFFTPNGVPTALSKASAIKELRNTYPHVSHVDDDPRTAVLIARLYPEVTVYLAQYGTTGLLFSRQEVDRYPNIQRVNMLQGNRQSNLAR